MRLIEILTKMPEIGKQLKELENAPADEAHENMELFAILSKAYKFYENELRNLGKGTIIFVTGRRDDGVTVGIYYVNVSREVAEMLFVARWPEYELASSKEIKAGELN
jgi:hypothetical protein